MKPKYIPLILILAVIFCIALFWAFKPDPIPVVEEPITAEMEYNFLTEALPPIEAGITEEDIAAYEAAKDDFSEEEKATFYAGAATSHTALDYGGYLDGQITEGTDTDLDLVVELMMADIYTLTEGQVATQLYRVPILTGSTTPEYVMLDTHYPARFLTEVMVRDALLAYLYPDYGPDREQYFRTGMVMGLYWESDIVNAQVWVEAYIAKALQAEELFPLLPLATEEQATTTPEVVLDAAMQAEIDQYSTAIDEAVNATDAPDMNLEITTDVE